MSHGTLGRGVVNYPGDLINFMDQNSSKNALVTGGSRGIGAAIVEALAGRGFQVFNADIAPPEKERDHVHFVETDVSSAGDRERLLEFCQSKCKAMDLLVNNAGISVSQRGDMLEVTEESLDHLLSVNLKGPFLLTQRIAKWMIEQVEIDTDLLSKPKIINMASLTSYVSATYMAPYGLSKSAVSMMTKLYADRLSVHGINVYEIRPGIIETSMTAPSREKYDAFIASGGLPVARWGTPEDIARVVIAIAGDLLPYSTGEVINVDGGYHLRRL